MDVRSVFTASLDTNNALGVQLINNLRGVSVSYATFAEKARQADPSGLIRNNLPNPVSDDEAFTRVVTNTRGFTRDERFDRVRRKGGAAVYTYNVRVSDGVEARWEVRGEVSYSREPGMVEGSVSTFKLPRDTGAQVRANFAWYRANLLTEDLSAFMAEVMTRCSAVCLRASGGVYFVPRGTMETAQVLVSVLRELCGRSAIGVINIPDDGEGGDHRAVVQTAAQDEFQAALAAAKLAAQQYVADLTNAVLDPSKRGPQARSMSARLTEVKALIDKVRLYGDLLAFRQEDVLKTANQLESFWRDSLGLPQ